MAIGRPAEPVSAAGDIEEFVDCGAIETSLVDGPVMAVDDVAAVGHPGGIVSANIAEARGGRAGKRLEIERLITIFVPLDTAE